MKKLILFKKLTSVYPLAAFVTVSLSISTLYAQETQSGADTQNNAALSDSQFQANFCTDVSGKRDEAQEKFAQSCSKAGLGASALCIERINECADFEEKNEDVPDYCLSFATSSDEQKEKIKQAREDIETRSDKEEELREQIEDKQGEIQALVGEAHDLALEADQAEAEHEQQLQQLKNARSEALRQAENNVEQLTNQIADERDKLTQLNLSLQRFMVEKGDECHEEAVQVRTNYIQNQRNLTQSGRRNRRSLHSLIASTGVSTVEKGTQKYNDHMIKCTSRNFNGQATQFGRQYNLRKKEINAQKQTINRTIRNLSQARSKQRRELKNSIAGLDSETKTAVNYHQKALNHLQNRKLAMLQQSARLQDELNTLRLRLMAAQNDTRAASNEKIALEEDRDVASDDKINAFNDASGLISSYESSVRNYNRAVDSCKDNQFVGTMMSLYDNTFGSDEDEAERDIATEDEDLDANAIATIIEDDETSTGEEPQTISTHP